VSEWFAGPDEQVTTSDRELAEMLGWLAEQRFFARSAVERRRLMEEIEWRLGRTPAGGEGEVDIKRKRGGQPSASPPPSRVVWAAIALASFIGASLWFLLFLLVRFIAGIVAR
jgi:hypothetical protein